MSLLTLYLFQEPESAKYSKVTEMNLTGYGLSSSQMMSEILYIQEFGHKELIFKS